MGGPPGCALRRSRAVAGFPPESRASCPLRFICPSNLPMTGRGPRHAATPAGSEITVRVLLSSPPARFLPGEPRRPPRVRVPDRGGGPVERRRPRPRRDRADRCLRPPDPILEGAGPRASPPAPPGHARRDVRDPPGVRRRGRGRGPPCPFRDRSLTSPRRRNLWVRGTCPAYRAVGSSGSGQCCLGMAEIVNLALVLGGPFRHA